MKKSLKRVLHTYDNSALLYELTNRLYFFGMDMHFRKELTEKTEIRQGDIVLNLCCGTGLDFPFLLEKIGRRGILLGVDVSSKMLGQSKKKKSDGEINLIRSDAAHLPFREKILNAVVVSFCLKITPALDKVVEEFNRLLKPNGRIGVLANHQPLGPLKFLGALITKVVSLISKVDFGIDLNGHFSRRFTILEDKKMHYGFVQLLIASTPKSSK